MAVLKSEGRIITVQVADGEIDLRIPVLRELLEVFVPDGTEDAANPNLRERMRRLLHRGIVAWRGEGYVDENGEPLPVTEENIDSLDAETTVALMEEYDKLMTPLAAKLVRRS